MNRKQRRAEQFGHSSEYRHIHQPQINVGMFISGEEYFHLGGELANLKEGRFDAYLDGKDTNWFAEETKRVIDLFDLKIHGDTSYPFVSQLVLDR